MEYYQHASRHYRTQNVWVRRCCLGVALLTAFVLSASLLSSPSSGVRSSRLVNFNGTETEYSPGVFDRLSGHVRPSPAASADRQPHSWQRWGASLLGAAR